MYKIPETILLLYYFKMDQIVFRYILKKKNSMGYFKKIACMYIAYIKDRFYTQHIKKCTRLILVEIRSKILLVELGEQISVFFNLYLFYCILLEAV